LPEGTAILYSNFPDSWPHQVAADEGYLGAPAWVALKGVACNETCSVKLQLKYNFCEFDEKLSN
jgi:hypothetical protein